MQFKYLTDMLVNHLPDDTGNAYLSKKRNKMYYGRQRDYF